MNETSPSGQKNAASTAAFSAGSEGVTRFQKQVLLLELAFELFIPGVHAVREGVVAGFNIAHCDVTVTSTQRDLLTDPGFQPQAYAVGEVMLTVIGERRVSLV